MKKIDIKISSKKFISIYYNPEIIPKASIIYFHGGGLIYGNRNDLPKYHLEKFIQSGYIIFALDYPLAPANKIDYILQDCLSSIDYYIDNISLITKQIYNVKIFLNFFLFGRSAGGYLVNLISSRLNEHQLSHLNGMILYYSYGLLDKSWYEQPSNFYNKLPQVNIDIEKFTNDYTFVGDLKIRYPLYVYARQNGLWKNLIYSGRDKFFYKDYSLLLIESLPKPIFITHSISDPDVPFSEFLAFTNKYKSTKYIVNTNDHDFDRDTKSSFTKELISETIKFLNDNI
ncbi:MULTISPECIES: alpha/beta hydrolase [Helcococcus]|uniref:Alpha/beta hydrolase n=1 Tax=Helcococcus bovis TaxID=3153252 RepID=A0ABW9F5N0_9FIRM